MRDVVAYTLEVSENSVAEVLSRLVAVADGEVRSDADAEVIADQFVAMASYAALLGRPLSDERVEATVGTLRAAHVAGRDVVVVDDVVTTGVTMAEAVRAVRAAGGRVVRCVALAEVEE